MLKEKCSLKRSGVVIASVLLGLICLSSSHASPLAVKSKARKRSDASTNAARARSAPAGERSEGASSAEPVAQPHEARFEALEQALLSQGEQLAELRRVIAEQQKVIESLVAANKQTENPVEAGERGTGSLAVGSPNLPEANSIAGEQTQKTPPIEDRVQRLEDRVKTVGPLKLSGDFRLRLDTTLRGATTPPDPPLAHQQNVRLRYRLRLNLDTEINPEISFHGQVATGPLNNGLTQDQDFTAVTARHPIMVSEAWIDYHPNRDMQLQGGRVPNIFADNSRFIFDDDVRFNGFNEKYVWHAGERAAVEARAGQYWFTNPNIAVVAPGSPLDHAAADIGSIGRSAMLFHQGLLATYKQSEKWSHTLGGDIQLFRQPNQIQLASTQEGVVALVQPGLGIALSGPMTGTGNATTTSGGAIYTARDFYVTRLTYRLSHSGIELRGRDYPFALNLQVARNAGTGANERDAMLVALQMGKPSKAGDMGFTYVFTIKGANSMISQLTDDDLGTGSGVNIRAHHFKWEIGLANKVTLQSLVFVQRQLRSSGQYPNFFVPIGAFAPRQYRFQEQILFTF